MWISIFNARITSIEFGENLVRIGDHANWSVVSLGNASFYRTSIGGCVDGRKIKIYGNFSFAHTHIIEFIFSHDTTVIRRGTFAYSKLAGEINLPNSVKKIEPYAFEFTLIEKLNFPPSLEIIGEAAFFSCERLTSCIPKLPFKKIGKDAFCGS